MHYRLIQSALSQAGYSVIRQIVFLPAVYRIDDSTYVVIMSLLLATDILINVLSASFADSYTREMSGVSNDAYKLELFYSVSQALVLTSGLVIWVISKDLLSTLFLTVYLFFYSKTLFLQKFKMNEGQLNANVIDFAFRALALLAALVLIYFVEGDKVSKTHLILVSLAAFQYVSFRVTGYWWRFSDLRFSVSTIRTISGATLKGPFLLLISYILMAAAMRGEIFVVGAAHGNSPNVFVYFSMILLCAYPMSLLASGPATNYYARIARHHFVKAALVLLLFSLAYSYIFGSVLAELIVGILYSDEVFTGSLILAGTVFLAVSANFLKPLVVLRANLGVLNICLAIYMVLFLPTVFLLSFDYTTLFLMSGLMKNLCLLLGLSVDKL